MSDTSNDLQVAIITGAGSGMGRATALLLAEAGYAVVLVGRTKETLDQTVRMMDREVGGQAQTMLCAADVTNEQAVEQLVQSVLERFGRIDALVNGAGDAPLQPIDRIEMATYRRCLDSNLTSVMLTTRAVWPTFKKQKSGVICNISSMASIDPFKGFNLYGAAKAGVNLFTKATADEGSARGIRAAAVAPGAVETQMLRANFSEKIIPKDKTLDPTEVAAVIRDIITGQREIDPGQTIPLPSP